MRLLSARTDVSVIALWLGHESIETTQVYLHADMTMKETALARTTPQEPLQAATRHPTTNSWPSCKASDYADLTDTFTALTSNNTNNLGITKTSA